MSRGGKRKNAGGKKPKLPPDQVKKQVPIRLSTIQKSRLQEASDKDGVTLSHFIREAALNAANWLLDPDCS